MRNAKHSLIGILALPLLLCAFVAPAHAQRVKDLTTLLGVRGNQLIGYGLVVGLDGTGDQTTQTPFTTQTLQNMLNALGIQLPPGVSARTLQLRNVAAVMVTATLPPFARQGQTLDVTVGSLGNARSLRGGSLLLTPLKGADGRTYANAQGSLLVAGAGGSAAGSSVQINSLNSGRIPAGATIEREVPTPVGAGEFVYLQVNQHDFTTVSRITAAANAVFGDGTAAAVDASQIRVRAPLDSTARVEFLAKLENLVVTPGELSPKVIVNARTGSVVMTQMVRVSECAVAHGNLSVAISTQPVISQPGAFSPGRTVATEQAQVEVKSEKGELVLIPGSANLNDIIKALNAVGATPLDLLAILQAMKAAGALKADLEII